MAVKTYDYLTPGNYDYDSNKIEVSGGIVKLKENLTNVYARWHLNEATGATVLDTSGNGRDGNPVFSPASVAGKLNTCLSFNGSNQRVDFGDIANFERTDSFSVECFFKTPPVSGNIDMMGRIATIGWAIFINPTGNIGFYMNSGAGVLYVVTNNSFDDDSFHHMIITYDGTSDASGLHIWIDNVDQVFTITTNNLSGSILNAGQFQIADMNWQSSDWNGEFDEVLIYDKELNSTEIAYKYNSGTGRENEKFYSDKPMIEPTILLDPATVQTWDSFLETLGGGNQGSIGYNLYKVDKSNKYYWNGSAWVTGGSSNNYNSASVINTNIGSFDASPDKIGFIVYLISDGEQQIELDENQITYTSNQAPSVNAGSNKSCKDNDIIAPFSDCSFSDPDGTIDHVYYKVDGEVDIWTEILQGGYGTLLEAVQAFIYLFNNTGAITCNLRAEDNVGITSDDSLIVTVEHYTVVFNVKDSQGNHIADINFKPGDGTGYVVKNSPFTYEYEYNVSGWDIVIDKGGYGIQTQNVPSTDHIENFTLISLIDTSDFLDRMKRLLGLSQENMRIINPSYSGTNLISATIKIYNSKADCESDNSPIAIYTMTASYDGNDNMTDYKSVKES